MSQEINLYEERLRPSQDWDTLRNVGIAALVVLLVTGAVGAWFGWHTQQAEQEAVVLQAELEEQQAQLTALSKAVEAWHVSPELAAKLKQIRERLSERRFAIEQLESGRFGSANGFSEIFTGFAHEAQANPKLWLTGFAVARGGTAIEIRGRTLDASVLPSYVQRLGNEPAFKGRRFSALEMDYKEIKPEAVAAQQGAMPAEPAKENAAMQRFVEFVMRSEVPLDASKDEVVPGGRTQ
ncbi:MAG: hypothetical protein LBG78_00440 [Azoarcus sp.]|jgi:MSHA biogenesis protein MshI|nr:hypothetical protein [Azoarcus sp.]